MESSPPDERRRARRICARMPLMFSVSGGAAEPGETVNLTTRSLAIRAQRPVEIGARVVVEVAGIKALYGWVVRSYAGGFAMRFDKSTIQLVALAMADYAPKDTKPVRNSSARIHSGPVRMSAEHLAWARLGTCLTGASVLPRHTLSILAATTAPAADIRGVWIKVAEARWIARVLNATVRRGHFALSIRLNGWQLDYAAEHGLEIEVVRRRQRRDSYKADAEFMRTHLQTIAAQASDGRLTA